MCKWRRRRHNFFFFVDASFSLLYINLIKCPSSMALQSVLQRLDSRLSSCLELEGKEPICAPFSDGVSPLRRSVYRSTASIPADNQYHVLYHDSVELFVKSLQEESNKPEHGVSLKIYNTVWDDFNDKTDNIRITGMTSPTFFKDKNVMFVASFHNNSVTMSQFHVIAFLCECLVNSLTILLPYYPTGTMERVDIGDDGVVPTANTLALLFNGLPSVGRPIRVMTYDIHTLQNRFYFTGHAVATLHTAIPLIIDKINHLEQVNDENKITAVAFPDEGAYKRFGSLLNASKIFNPDDIIICSKVRDGDKKKVKIAEGNAEGKHVIIIDDQTKSGGTLIECAQVLKNIGNAKLVSAYVTHAICTDEFWSKFIPGYKLEDASMEKEAPIDIFHKFYCTDSFPIRSELEKVVNGKDLTWKTRDGAGKNSSHSIQINVSAGNSIKNKLEILPLAELVLKDL